MRGGIRWRDRARLLWHELSGEDTDTSHYGALVQRFAELRVLVLGDMVADEYIVGRPARISREAPVLVLHFANSFVRPGGATNPACNLHTLGAATSLIGTVGDDPPGRELLRTLTQLGLATSGLIVDKNRPTSTKTRIIGKGTQEVQQQIVRIDRIDDGPLDASLRDRMIDATLARLADVDALLVSDYENGVISQEVIDACIPEATRRGLVTVVDSHGDLFRFKGVTAATPNQPEAESTVGTRISTEADLDLTGRLLLEGMNAGGVLITRGSEGVVLYEQGRDPYRLPVSVSDGSQIVDPTGAGDTVAAVFTLAITAGAAMRAAAFLGNVAGGEVVRRHGAAVLSPVDLAAAIQHTWLPAP